MIIQKFEIIFDFKDIKITILYFVHLKTFK